MQMNPCPYCGEKTRLGVTVKQLRSGANEGYLGAYGRCKRCHARGPIIRFGAKNYLKDIGIPHRKEDREKLVDLAVTEWNGGGRDRPIHDLPLFQDNGADMERRMEEDLQRLNETDRILGEGRHEFLRRVLIDWRITEPRIVREIKNAVEQDAECECGICRRKYP